MTKQERLIVSAYTGYLMCDIGDLKKYMEEKMGRPVWTHDLSAQEFLDELREKTKPDFLALCSDE